MPTRYCLLIALVTWACTEPPDASQPHTVSTTVLFDGTSFNGWEGNLDWFRIEEEAIVGGSLEKTIPRNEFLCTNQRFTSFELRFQTRVLGEQTNAGVQFHTERILGDHEVIGYQADIGEGYWGGLYDESRRNRVLSSPAPTLIDSLIQPGAWIHYTVRAEGSRSQLYIRGHKTVDYTEEQTDIPLTGRICLQIHSGPPGEVWYRDIRIEEL